MNSLGQYDGHLISDLYALVDNNIDLERIRRDMENAQVCGNCRRTLGQHTHEGHFCPTLQGPSRQTKFRLMSCSACVPMNSTGEEAFECGKPVVGDTGFCTNHQEASQ